LNPLPTFAEREPVIVWRNSESYLLNLLPGVQSVEGRGVIDLSPVIGKSPGATVEWAGVRFRVLRPTLSDFLFHLKRTAQIITPKDAQYLLFLAGVKPGGQVAEAGTGSGALTTVLAWAVGPEGRVLSYDRRAEYLSHARENLMRYGLADRVQFCLRDVAQEGLDSEPLESIVLDLAEPWAVIPKIRGALETGGQIASFSPTYNQLEQTVRTLRSEGFGEIRSVELLERALHVGEGGTRPEFEMLGHTGFLTGARRVE
jgi:tRNA (adenine57-N1/adenine58-N1)-methyltransferase